MSIKILTAIFDSPIKFDPTEKLVLLSLADWSNDDGVCWPSVIRVGVRACVSERQARTWLTRIEECGYVRRNIHQGNSGQNTYQFNMKWVLAGCPASGSGLPEVDNPTNRKSAAPPTGSRLPPIRQGTVREPLDNALTSEELWNGLQSAKDKPVEVHPWDATTDEEAYLFRQINSNRHLRNLPPIKRRFKSDQGKENFRLAVAYFPDIRQQIDSIISLGRRDLDSIIGALTYRRTHPLKVYPSRTEKPQEVEKRNIANTDDLVAFWEKEAQLEEEDDGIAA